MKFPTLQFTAPASLVLALCLTTGCRPQPPHPNQMNAFDGAAYDAMTLAHGALTSLRASILVDFPRYAPEFNETAEAYDTALAIYSAYRHSEDAQPSLSAALGNLTVGVTSLESALIADLPIDLKRAAETRKTAQQLRARANFHITVVDILTELEIAASLASTVSTGEDYPELAKIVIKATEAALTLEKTQAGQPIQMETIAAITPIS